MQPNPHLIKIGTILFKRAWDQFCTHTQDQHKAIKRDITKLDKTIDSFLTRIVEADNPKVIKAYETKIATLEMQKMAYAENSPKTGLKRSPMSNLLELLSSFC